jgi:UDP:flavonoid glycosyltransferase YjiC (YdhE family)
VRVLGACSLGGASHLRPLLPVLAAARRQGHDVVVVAPGGLGDMVTAAGHRFVCGGEPPEAEVASIRERLPVAAPAEASSLGNRDLFGHMATAAMLPTMERTCRSVAPDLVVREPCEYASAVVARRRQVRVVQVAISLAEVEAGSITIAAPALEAHQSGLVEALWSTPYLTRFPESLDPSPFPHTVRLREPASEAGPAHTPDEDARVRWWAGHGRPRIYMTLGTVLGYMSIAADAFRLMVATAALLDARVLLAVGRRFDPSTLGPLPPNVRVTSWVDQATVVRQADLVVCHGGSGTVFDALEAGVALVVVPLFADQFENGRRVTNAGAGRSVEAGVDPGGSRRPVTDIEAAALADQIRLVMGDPGYRRHARRVASEMAARPSVDEVLAGLLDGVGGGSDEDR